MGGIIAYSQALAPQFMSGGKYILIPSAFHQPLGQRMVLLKNSGEPAKRFYEYLGRETARKIFRKNGYALESGEG